MASEAKATRKIPFFKATIGEEEIASVVETLKSGWLTTGPKVKTFESKFAEFVGTEHAVAVNSATAGLHLSLESLGIGPGDEVLVPTMTFAATAEVVIHLGANPILVDCKPDNLNICVDNMRLKRTAKTKAIIPVLYGGHACQMNEIHEFAKQHTLAVIEDAAHAFPAKYEERKIGSLSDVTCFSFYANKTITTGEGGMCTTNDAELAARIRQMSLHGLSRSAWNRFSAKGSWYYEIEAPGYKYNMADTAAAIGIGQLEKAENFLVQRTRVAERYTEGLKDVEEIELLDVSKNVQHSWHLFVIKLKLESLTIDRSDFIVKLNESGIGTSVHYTPLHLHPLYQKQYGYQESDLPNASQVFQQIISLPIFASMTNEDVDYVVQMIKRIVSDHKKP